jgi:hypothetical protein
MAAVAPTTSHSNHQFPPLCSQRINQPARRAPALLTEPGLSIWRITHSRRERRAQMQAEPPPLSDMFVQRLQHLCVSPTIRISTSTIPPGTSGLLPKRDGDTRPGAGFGAETQGRS